MNHIKKLQLENAVLREALQAIKSYCNSSKFALDNQCNVNDILLRIEEHESDLASIEIGNVSRHLEEQFLAANAGR
jgi:hypothetical protein